ncbi:MAG: metal-dependent hydrolase [Anaerolineae bacterium]|jgi:membrane-bound metal-dependent hydrolase YbcI (DUF457 family)
MFGISPEGVVWTAVFAIALTVVTNLGVAWLRRAWRWRIGGIIANLLWAALVFAGGLIALRYIERMEHAALGYALFGSVALALSLLQAVLWQTMPAPRWRWPAFGPILHEVVYLLAATVLYFLLAWVADMSVLPGLLVPLWIGALLPELDSPDTPAGRLLPFLSRRLAAAGWGPAGVWHSLGANVIVAVLALPLAFLSIEAWYLVPLGFFAHLLLDLFRTPGIPVFWPLRETRYSLWGGALDPPGGRAETRLAAVLTAIGIALLLVVDVGPRPPPAVAAPSYEENVARYYSWRGRYLVFAYIQGTWQATGRRMSGRFEVLNAREDSFTMLDRYTGDVFTAGRGAEDNLYLNYLSLQTGDAIAIKPVEVTLDDQLLGEALAVVYEMQKEPGLQHIYASGDVVLDDAHNLAAVTLEPDLSQLTLRRVQEQAPGHYALRYLTAAELIELASLPVARGELVIAATYVTPPVGPTPTALPALPPKEVTP